MVYTIERIAPRVFTRAFPARTTRLGCGEGFGAAGPLNDRRWLDNLLAEKVALDEVWKPDLQLIAKELLSRDRKDLVNFLERLFVC